MLKQELSNIYTSLVKGETVDITPYAKEEYKEYVDTKDDERLITKMTLEYEKGLQSVIIASRYRGEELEESHFYYLDQKDQLRKLMNTWLNMF